MKTPSEEKEIIYSAKNTYSTLNHRTEQTKNVWFVCHGMGYLSRYFIKYFKDLDPVSNYIIAPQAPSKYYQQPKMHVGANWLTRDNTPLGMENVINYFDAIFDAEQLHKVDNLIVFGYSQGVSVSMRYVVKRQIQCAQLIMHSSGIPKELRPGDFDFLNHKFIASLVYGTKDKYLNDERINEETAKAKSLFAKQLQIHSFDGGHIVNQKFIKKLDS